MSVAVFGKVSNLIMGCDHGERHFYGEVAVQASHKIQPDWLNHHRQWLDGIVHIFGQRSEECYSHLMISAKEQHIQQLLESFSELTSLAEVRRYEEFLGITVMLAAADFNWFSNFVEAHYFNDLEYLFHLPIVGFAQEATIETTFWTKHGAYVPTAESFSSGKPFFIPNKSMSFRFQHLSDEGMHKYKWLESQKEIRERQQRADQEARAAARAIESRNRELDQLLVEADARRAITLRRPKWKTAIWWGVYIGVLVSLAAAIWL